MHQHPEAKAAEKRKAEAIDIDSDLFDEEITEEDPDKETPPPVS